MPFHSTLRLRADAAKALAPVAEHLRHSRVEVIKNCAVRDLGWLESEAAVFYYCQRRRHLHPVTNGVKVVLVHFFADQRSIGIDESHLANIAFIVIAVNFASSESGAGTGKVLV